MPNPKSKVEVPDGNGLITVRLVGKSMAKVSVASQTPPSAHPSLLSNRGWSTRPRARKDALQLSAVAFALEQRVDTEGLAYRARWSGAPTNDRVTILQFSLQPEPGNVVRRPTARQTSHRGEAH